MFVSYRGHVGKGHYRSNGVSSFLPLNITKPRLYCKGPAVVLQKLFFFTKLQLIKCLVPLNSTDNVTVFQVIVLVFKPTLFDQCWTIRSKKTNKSVWNQPEPKITWLWLLASGANQSGQALCRRLTTHPRISWSRNHHTPRILKGTSSRNWSVDVDLNSYLVMMAGRIMGATLLNSPPKKSQSPQSTLQQPIGFLSDPSFMLNFEYVLMNSGRRYRVPLCKYININRSQCQFNLLTGRSWRANRLRSKTSEGSTFKQAVFL